MFKKKITSSQPSVDSSIDFPSGTPQLKNGLEPSQGGTVPSIFTEKGAADYNTDQLRQQQVKTDQQKALSDRLFKLRSELSPKDQQNFDRAQQFAVSTLDRDGLRDFTPKEVAHQQFMDSTPGKIIGAAGYLAGKGGKGLISAAKGLAGFVEDFAPSTDEGSTMADLEYLQKHPQPSVSAPFFDKAMEMSDLGLNKTDMANIESGTGGKLLSNLGGAIEFGVPAMVGSAAKVPATITMGLQGLGMAKQETENMEKEGKYLSPGVKKGYEYANMALMSVLGRESGLFGKMPSSLRRDVVGAWAANAIKQAVQKDLTGAEFKALLENGAKDLASKGTQALYNIADTYKKAVTDLTFLNIGGAAIKKGVDVAEGKEVFDPKMQDLLTSEMDIITKSAPAFAVGGGLLHSKLMPYSSYKNAVVEELMRDPSPQNTGRVKSEIAKESWSPDEIQATNDHVDQIAKIASGLKATEKAFGGTIPAKKLEDAVDLVAGKQELTERLAAISEGKKDLVIQTDKKTPIEQDYENKIDQANDKLHDLITGEETRYVFDNTDKKYYKKRRDETVEEIEKPRWEMERREKDAGKEPVINTAEPQVTSPEAEATVAVNQFTESKPSRKDFDDGKAGDKPYANSMRDYHNKLNTHLSGLPDGTITDSEGRVFNVRTGIRGVVIEDEFGQTVFKKGDFTSSGNPINGKFEFKPKIEVKATEYYDEATNTIKVKEDNNLNPTENEKVTNEEDVKDVSHQEVNANGKEDATQNVNEQENGGVLNGTVNEGNVQQNDQQEHQGIGGQQSGKQENRQHEEKPIPQSQNQTGSSNSVEQSGEKQQEVNPSPIKEDLTTEAKGYEDIPVGTKLTSTIKDYGQSYTLQNVEGYKIFIGDKDGLPLQDGGNVLSEKAVRHIFQKELPKSEPKVEKTLPKSSLTEEEQAEKIALRKEFGLGKLNSLFDPTLLANAKFRRYASLVLKEAVGDFKAWSKEMIDEFGDAIKEHLPKLFKELGGDENLDDITKVHAGLNKGEKPKVENVGVKHESLNAIAKSLGLEPIKRGTYTPIEDLIERGRKLRKAGVDAVEVARNFQEDEDKAVSANMISVVRSQAEDYLKDVNDAYKKFGEKSQEYKDAKEKWESWDKEVVKPMGTASGEAFYSLQGETDAETGSFVELERAAEAVRGKPLKPEQTEELKRISKVIEKNSLNEDDIDKLDKSQEENVKANEPKQKKLFTDKAKKIADDFRKLKTKPFIFKDSKGNTIQIHTSGISWNDAVEFGAKAIEKTGQIADGVAEVLEKIKDTDWYKSFSSEDKEAFKNQLEQHYIDTASSKEDRLIASNVKRLQRELDDLREGTVKDKKDKRTPTDIEKDLKEQIISEKQKLGLIPAKPLPEQTELSKLKNKLSDLEEGASTDENGKVKETPEIREVKQKIADKKQQLSFAKLVQSVAGKTDNVFTPQQAYDIWKYAKTYLDKKPSFMNMLKNVSYDLGLKPEQVRDAIATPKSAKKISDEIYLKNNRRTMALNAARKMVREAGTGLGATIAKNIPNDFRIAATYAHGTVAPFTHASYVLYSDPAKWSSLTAKSWKYAYGNTANYERAMEDLQLRPNFALAKRFGLKNDPLKVDDFYQTGYNEEGRNKLLKFFKRLGIAGDRGFNALKVVRQDIFDAQYNALPEALKEDEVAIRGIVDDANHATGTISSELPKGFYLNTIFFAPKIKASVISNLVTDPVKAAEIFANWDRVTPSEKLNAIRTAKRAGIALASYATSLAVNAALNRYVFYPDDKKQWVNMTDPSKADWGMYKAFDKRFGLTGWTGSAVRLLYSLANQTYMGWTGMEPQKDNPADTDIETLGKQARYALSPFGSTGADVITTTDAIGRPLPFSKVKNKYLKPYTIPEYLFSKAPIPINEGLGVIKDEMDNQDVPKYTTKAILNGIFSAIVSGSTGIRVAEDIPVKDKSLYTPEPHTTVEYYNPATNKMDVYHLNDQQQKVLADMVQAEMKTEDARLEYKDAYTTSIEAQKVKGGNPTSEQKKIAEEAARRAQNEYASKNAIATFKEKYGTDKSGKYKIEK